MILQSLLDPEADETSEDNTIVLPEERKRVIGHPDHFRVYGRDYTDRFEQAGFIVRVDRWAKGLGPAMFKKHVLMKDEDKYFCLKPKSKER